MSKLTANEFRSALLAAIDQEMTIKEVRELLLKVLEPDEEIESLSKFIYYLTLNK